MYRSIAACLLCIAGCGPSLAPIDAGLDATEMPPQPIRVLLFTYTNGFRHDSIPDGIAAFSEIAIDRAWQLDTTEDPARFTDASLSTYDAIIFLSTTGDLLDPVGQGALSRWVEAGGGWVGVHAAADAEYDWPWYGELVGAWFLQHPAVQEATLTVDRIHPITADLPAMWTRTDEWYDFRRNPRDVATVLITIDETTYSGGTMGADHPMTWLRTYDGGRSFYTALGHTPESYADPAFRTLLANAVEWAARGP
jgi:type 1 glutamine amidotransferase